MSTVPVYDILRNMGEQKYLSVNFIWAKNIKRIKRKMVKSIWWEGEKKDFFGEMAEYGFWTDI
jgi:hypothetical protein